MQQQVRTALSFTSDVSLKIIKQAAFLDLTFSLGSKRDFYFACLSSRGKSRVLALGLICCLGSKEAAQEEIAEFANSSS